MLFARTVVGLIFGKLTLFFAQLSFNALNLGFELALQLINLGVTLLACGLLILLRWMEDRWMNDDEKAKA